jgi:MerR family transcriptional regulator/heat shock protein HspR
MYIFLKIIKEKAKALASGDEPLYSIASVSKMLRIHPRTLMKYEKLGLMKPYRDPKNNRRFYSNNDIKWISCIAKLVHEDGFNLKSLGYVLSLAPCWVVMECPEEMRKECQAYYNRSKPCWETINTVCRPCVNRISCSECVFFQASQKRKDLMLSSIDTILSK